MLGEGVGYREVRAGALMRRCAAVTAGEEEGCVDGVQGLVCFGATEGFSRQNSSVRRLTLSTVSGVK